MKYRSSTLPRDSHLASLHITKSPSFHIPPVVHETGVDLVVVKKINSQPTVSHFMVHYFFPQVPPGEICSENFQNWGCMHFSA